MDNLLKDIFMGKSFPLTSPSSYAGKVGLRSRTGFDIQTLITMASDQPERGGGAPTTAACTGTVLWVFPRSVSQGPTV